MKSLDTLRNEAQEAAKRRGHWIKWLHPFFGERTSIQDGKCRVCGAPVQIDVSPLPNGIDMGGEALAMNCNDACFLDCFVDE